MKSYQIKAFSLAVSVLFMSIGFISPVDCYAGKTMNMLNVINDKLDQVIGPPAPVEKTGQTIALQTGDDGDFEAGVFWPDPRFTDNGDGTATDNLTWLIWQKNLPSEYFSWSGAISYCDELSFADQTDWRLANIKELQWSAFPSCTTVVPR